MKQREQRRPTLLEAGISLLVVVGVIVVGICLNVNAQMSLFFGGAVAMAAALLLGTRGGKIQVAIQEMLNSSVIVILILLIVGVIIGVWIACGTVPALMYYGLKFCTPGLILPLTFLLCMALSVLIGTSYGAIATMGLALTGVAVSMGIPAELVAGAVVSGAFFGDKTSPLSGSVNMTSALTGISIQQHIGSMMCTTAPAALVSLVLYAVLGMQYSGSGASMADIDSLLTALNDTFHISPILLIPVLLMIILTVKKVPAILGLSGCAVFSILFALVMQDTDFATVMDAGLYGYVSNTGTALVDTILTRGGMNSMMGTVTIVIMATLLGGALQASGILSTFVEDGLMKLIHGPKSLSLITTLLSSFILLVSGNQTLGVVMCSATLEDVYDKMDIHPNALARIISDTSIVGIALIPWGGTAIYVTEMLDVSLGYIPYAFLCYLIPVFTVLCPLLGFGLNHKNGTPYRSKHKAFQP